MSAHTHSHTVIAFIAAMTLRSDFKVLSKSNVGPTSHPVLPSPILSTYLLRIGDGRGEILKVSNHKNGSEEAQCVKGDHLLMIF